VFPAHVSCASAAAPSTWRYAHPWQSVFRLLQTAAAISFAGLAFSQSDQVLCRFRLALQRKSGPRIALPAHQLCYPGGKHVASVDHTGLLRRPARCSVITQRARMQQRPSSATASVSECAASCFVCGSSAGQSRRKNGLPHPGREPRGCLHAGGEKRGHLAAPGRQTKWGGISRRASRI
jgi:hypothetical protein